MRLLPLFALLLVAALVPASAQANRTQVSDEPASNGPELAGELAVYQAPSSTERVIRAAGPGSPPRTLFSTSIPQEDPDDDCCNITSAFDWSVSPTRLAAQTFSQEDSMSSLLGADIRLVAGPLNGPFADVYACSKTESIKIGAFDVDGDRLAFVRGSCSEPPGIVVRNLATGATEATVPAPPAGTEFGTSLVLAGPYLAIARRAAGSRQDTTVVVRNLATGSDVINAPANGRQFDLQPDGKLVAATNGPPGPSGCPRSVAWYSPAAPTRHALPFCPDGRPRIAADRVLLRASAAGAERDHELVLSDLAGASRPLVRSKNIDQIEPAYDLDPTRAAYATRTCSLRLGEVYIDDLAAGDPLQANVDCPARVIGRRLRARSNRTVTVRVRCPKGCNGVVSLKPRRRGRRLAAPKRFDSGPGTARVKLRLSRPARRALNRRGRLKARVTGARYDPADGVDVGFARRVTVVGRRR